MTPTRFQAQPDAKVGQCGTGRRPPLPGQEEAASKAAPALSPFRSRRQCYRFPCMRVAERAFTRRLVFVLRPTNAEFDAMLAELGQAFPQRDLSAVLGIPTLTLEGWRKRKNGPCAAARRLVWLLWGMIFAPDRVKTVFDIQTWALPSVASSASRKTDGCRASANGTGPGHLIRPDSGSPKPSQWRQYKRRGGVFGGRWPSSVRSARGFSPSDEVFREELSSALEPPKLALTSQRIGLLLRST